MSNSSLQGDLHLKKVFDLNICHVFWMESSLRTSTGNIDVYAYILLTFPKVRSVFRCFS